MTKFNLKCSNCMQEIDESEIVEENGKLVKYPAYCKKCENWQ